MNLEFINLIIPRDRIEAVYNGGWDQFVSDNQSAIGGRVWFDDHLMRDGAMSPGKWAYSSTSGQASGSSEHLLYQLVLNGDCASNFQQMRIRSHGFTSPGNLTLRHCGHAMDIRS